MDTEFSHVMELDGTRAGYERWHCPTCGRVLAVSWEPTYERVVLQAGNEGVAHTATKAVPGISFTVDSFVEEEDPYLSLFDAWLENRGGA